MQRALMWLNLYGREAVRKQPKNIKNAFLACFRAYVGQPHGHIHWASSMPFASINPTNPRTNLWNFHENFLRIGDFEKRRFFESAILMGQNFDQAKCDNTFWPRPNILTGSVPQIELHSTGCQHPLVNYLGSDEALHFFEGSNISMTSEELSATKDPIRVRPEVTRTRAENAMNFTKTINQK